MGFRALTSPDALSLVHEFALESEGILLVHDRVVLKLKSLVHGCVHVLALSCGKHGLEVVFII